MLPFIQELSFLAKETQLLKIAMNKSESSLSFHAEQLQDDTMCLWF